VDHEEFQKWSRRAADWGADYRATLRERPVRAQTQPGDIAALIGPLDPDASATGDGGGRARTARYPIEGAERIVRSLFALFRRLAGPAWSSSATASP